MLKTGGDPKKNKPNRNNNESVLSKIWNSNFARKIVPDELGIHLGGVITPTFGIGYSYNIDLLTLGKDARLHKSASLSLRVGEEVSFGLSFITGDYQGPVRDLNYNSMMGLGSDANAGIGFVTIGMWMSYDKIKGPTWIGTTAGYAAGAGGSVGVSYTVPIK